MPSGEEVGREREQPESGERKARTHRSPGSRMTTGTMRSVRVHPLPEPQPTPAPQVAQDCGLPHSAEEHRREWRESILGRRAKLAEELARCPHTPADVLEEIGGEHSYSTSVNEALVANPATPAHLMRRAVEIGAWRVKAVGGVVTHPGYDQKTAEKLIAAGQVAMLDTLAEAGATLLDGDALQKAQRILFEVATRPDQPRAVQARAWEHPHLPPNLIDDYIQRATWRELEVLARRGDLGDEQQLRVVKRVSTGTLSLAPEARRIFGTLLKHHHHVGWETRTRINMHNAGWPIAAWNPLWSEEQWRRGAELTDGGWEAGIDELEAVVDAV